MRTHKIHFHDKIRNFPLNIHKYFFSCAIGRTPQRLKKKKKKKKKKKNKFESATVKETSEFESLKFYCEFDR